ncbi:metallophosphoesterase [Natronorarus salvus]|uniref:metallophosphoesterase n=1 Tax=Natronorarus salvus TaxID=3117733 RepID=UPI002F25F308
MARVEPVPNHPAATCDLGTERALVIADYHAGYEAALRYERGVEVPSRAESRRRRTLDLLAGTDADRLVVLGDLMHSIGGPGGAERGELEVLFESVSVPITVVKGNHDGEIETVIEDAREHAAVGSVGRIDVSDGDGVRLGDVGFAHGHSWPSTELLESEVLCIGHEHPHVRLVDEVGGRRIEPAWLRGDLRYEPFAERIDLERWRDPDLVVLPAFNDLVGGTWVNVGSEFLCPFLPEGLAGGEAYLLDGTRLGPYDRL